MFGKYQTDEQAWVDTIKSVGKGGTVRINSMDWLGQSGYIKETVYWPTLSSAISEVTCASIFCMLIFYIQSIYIYTFFYVTHFPLKFVPKITTLLNLGIINFTTSHFTLNENLL